MSVQRVTGWTLFHDCHYSSKVVFPFPALSSSPMWVDKQVLFRFPAAIHSSHQYLSKDVSAAYSLSAGTLAGFQSGQIADVPSHLMLSSAFRGHQIKNSGNKT